MRIIQMLPTMVSGDGVGNDVLQFDKIIREAGYNTHIYAEKIGAGLDRKKVSPVAELPEPDADDILIYHQSTGSPIWRILRDIKCRIIFRYHNITPAHFFSGYAPLLEKNCRDGIEQFKAMRDIPDACLAVSEYNRQHLQSLGYECPIEVLPIILKWEDYDSGPNDAVLKKYNDGRKNIIFVGRVVPNKCAHDVIAAFAVYHKMKNPGSRLIFVGNYQGMERYLNELNLYTKSLGLGKDDVVYTGRASFDEIIAYYRLADLFLCMSMHEGFCIPLLEAMHFGVPIIARDTSAVGDTLGEGGILLKDNDPYICAEIMDVVLSDKAVGEKLADGQKRQLSKYKFDVLKEQFVQALRKV